MLFRYLLIIGLITYVFYKIGSFFFRAGAASQQLRNYERQQAAAKRAQKSEKKIKGGEYIDYEEIK